MGKKKVRATTATGDAEQFNWTGSKKHGRWKTKYAKPYTQVKGQQAMARKAETEKALFSAKSGLRAWKGNEWAQKALNEAWETDYKGYRTMSTSFSPARRKVISQDAGDRVEIKRAGYLGLNEEGVSQFSSYIASRAQQIHSESIRSEESAKRMGARKARGGMGARGSTIMTGGHKGVLEEAKTKKQTLIGV